MKIKLYRSATVGIISNNAKILVDPWLIDGEYYGSWSHYPFFDFEKKIEEINSYDCIYISHIHPDHCSKKTLEKINKDIPIYIHKFHQKFLRFNLERMGFKVLELEHGKRTKIKNNLHINIFAADNCDPELCYKFSGCAKLEENDGGSQQIDTLSVIDDGKATILNTNDCPLELAKSNFKKIKDNYDKIDVLLTAYCGAGPYPQCLENLSDNQKIIEGNKKKTFFLDQACGFINEINPRYFMPFAGTYTLTGKLSNLNKFKGVPSIDTAYDYIEKFLNLKNKRYIQPIKINNDEIFDISIGEQSNDFKIFDEVKFQNYLENILYKKKLDYEDDTNVNFEELYELSKKASQRFYDKKFQLNNKIDTNIYLDLGAHLIKIDNQKNNIDLIKKHSSLNNEKYIKYTVDLKLLKKLLLGPKFAHWNNAEIGSHIKFYRNPNIFERNIYENMNYFHG
jgi:UDP-MurNAc hydroxylase